MTPFHSYILTELGLAPNSVAAYLYDLASFARSGVDLQTFGAGHVAAWAGAGVSAATHQRRIAAVRLFLRFQHRVEGRDVRVILARITRPRVGRRLPVVLGREQVMTLIDAAHSLGRLAAPLQRSDDETDQRQSGAEDSPSTEKQEEGQDMAGEPGSPDYDFGHKPPPEKEGRLAGAVLELLYASGLRASELCSLNVADIDFDAAEVRVMGKGRKERVVPVGQSAIDILRAYLGERKQEDQNGGHTTAPVFRTVSGERLSRFDLWKLVKRVAAQSGISATVSPHTLRHCCATHLLGGGANIRVIQEILGHSDVGTTQTYTHVDFVRLKEVHKLLGR